LKKIYEWIDRAWQWIAERVFVRFEFDFPVDELKKISNHSRIVFALTHVGLTEYLIISSWCRSQGMGAIGIVNRRRILLFSNPKFFFQIIFRRKTFSDLFLSDDQSPRLLFCPPNERKRLFEPVAVERLLFDLYSARSGNSPGLPFHFVPLFILWRKHVRGAARKPSEYLFGLSSNPNFIGKIYYLLRQRKDSVVRALPNLPMATQDEMGDGLEESETMRLAKTTRRRILIETQLEMRVVLGPRYSSPYSVKETLLRDPEIQRIIQEVADKEGVDRKRIMSRAYANLTEIVANYRYRTIEVLYVILTWFFTKVFDGVSVEEEELQRVREIMKAKPVVFVSCHRSHLDYLVVPYILFLHDMVTPHIAAGVNLSFWPAGPLLRSGGAFFIRRSFRGDALYSVCLRKYVEYLLKNKYNIKFFIEGTRSRSGKMLAPAYGFLKMILQAQRGKVCEDIALIPVSICYDEVPEQGAYTKELGGGQKVKESVKELVRSRDIISKNIGKVYVRLAPAIYARDVIKNELTSDDSSLVLQKTAFQICKEINDVSPITVKSLVSSILLGYRYASLSLEEILSLAGQLKRHVEWAKFPLSVGDQNFRRSVEQTVRHLQKGGIISLVDTTVPRAYSCDRRKRIVLNFYKNNGMHFFVMPSIAILSLFFSVRDVAPTDTGESLFDRARKVAIELRNILKFEFFFSPTSVFLDELCGHYGYLLGLESKWSRELSCERNAGEWISSLRSRFSVWEDLSIYLRLLGDLLESYGTAVEYLRQTKESSVEKKALLQKILKAGELANGQDRIAFPESISVQTYSNCLLLLENLKFLTAADDGTKKMILVGKWNTTLDQPFALIRAISQMIELPPDENLKQRGFLASPGGDSNRSASLTFPL
jgi:glycerol-3-phosphate O-acyltransferase